MNSLNIKKSLRDAGKVIGTWVFEFNTPGITRVLASTGVDFIVYDMEHSGFGLDTIRSFLAQSRPLSIASFVRPPAGQYHLIAPVLDARAAGIIVPKVETAEEAARIVEACKYYPEGCRVAAFSVAHDDFLPGDIAGKMKDANESMFCALLFESAQGVEDLDKIVAVPGADLIWVGHLDLSLSLGIRGQFTHPRFKQATDRILQPCKAKGIPLGILVNDAHQALDCIHEGYQCLSYASDLWLLQRTLSEGIGTIRRSLQNISTEEKNALKTA